MAHRAWKRSLRLGESLETRSRNYDILKRWRAKVAKLEGQVQEREGKEFMDRVGKRGDRARSNTHFWRYWRARVGKSQAPGSIKQGGKEFNTTEGIQEALGNHFRELNVPHTVREGDIDRVKTEVGVGLGEGEEVIERSLLEDVTMEEVKGSVRGLKNGKAMGVDNIPNEFLKKGGPTLWGLLAKAFNMAIREERIPSVWREGQVLLLHKGGERDSLDNYRGITVSSNVGKVFTRVTAARLEHDVEGRGLLGKFNTDSGRGRVRRMLSMYLPKR